MSKPPRAFALAIRKYGSDAVPDFMKARVTVLALDGMRSLTQLTPVDRGRLKGNWQFSLGEPARGEIEEVDPSPEGTPSGIGEARVFQVMPEWKVGEWIWFHNGVPYGTFVNDGTERMAGHYMVERTRERLERSAQI